MIVTTHTYLKLRYVYAGVKELLMTDRLSTVTSYADHYSLRNLQQPYTRISRLP